MRLGQGGGAHARMSFGEESFAVAFAVGLIDLIALAPDFEIEAVEIVFIRVIGQKLVMHPRQARFALLNLGHHAYRGGAVIGLGDKGVSDGFHVAFPVLGPVR